MHRIAFKTTGPNAEVGFIFGHINKKTSDQILNWVKAKNVDRTKGLLLIHSKGGVADHKLLDFMLKTDIHVHVMNFAGSWAGMLALVSNSFTANPGSSIMVHESSWMGLKESESMTVVPDLLADHNYMIKNVLKSVLPDSSVKERILKAKESTRDVIFDCRELERAGIVKKVCNVDLTGLAHPEDAKLIEDTYNG